jgi:hypothetical protein
MIQGMHFEIKVREVIVIILSKLTKRFRVALEESWQGELASNPERRWLEIIPCKGFQKGPGQEGSFIGLFSEDPPTLQLYSDRPITAKKIWQAIKDHPGTRADFALDGEAVLFFPPALLEQVAELAGGRKRRQLSEEQRTKLIEAGKRTLYAPRKSSDHGAESKVGTKNEDFSPAQGVSAGGQG